MKTVDFAPYAGGIAYAYAYEYATLLFESDVAPDYHFLLNEAIQFIREFAVNMELDHGIELDITERVLALIDEDFEKGWWAYLNRAPGFKRVVSPEGIQRHAGSFCRVEEVTRSAHFVHHGEAKVMIVLPMASCILDFKLVCLDFANMIIKESK